MDNGNEDICFNCPLMQVCVDCPKQPPCANTIEAVDNSAQQLKAEIAALVQWAVDSRLNSVSVTLDVSPKPPS